jgi:tRNA(fMet)-specific endonuclease VapC
MATYMLDTETVSLAIRGEGRAGPRVLRHPRSQVCTSSLVVAELRFGAENKQSSKLHDLITVFLSNIEVMPFDQAAADTFGRVSASLGRRGQPIGPIDTLIASHALSLGLVLVTSNTRHFARVQGLKVESWA